MANKVYTIYSDSDWDTAPDYYLANPEMYQPMIDKAVKALAETGGNVMLFRHVNEAPDSMILKYADEGEDVVATVNGTALSEFTEDDCEINWRGVHLKVYADGSIQLYWESKHTSDRMWTEFFEVEFEQTI